KHGKKVKFLTFKEAQERLNKNVLGGIPIRHPEDGNDNGVRLLDIDNDGYLDAALTNEKVRLIWRWQPLSGSWRTHNKGGGGLFQSEVQAPRGGMFRGHFGIFDKGGGASLILPRGHGWDFDLPRREAIFVLPFERWDRFAAPFAKAQSFLFRDVDGDRI